MPALFKLDVWRVNVIWDDFTCSGAVDEDERKLSDVNYCAVPDKNKTQELLSPGCLVLMIPADNNPIN